MKFKLSDKSGPRQLCSAKIGEGEHRLLLTSWAELLEHMETQSKLKGDSVAEADIQQLRGLTNRMDTDIFVPWRSEDLGPEFPKRVLGLITLVDDATNSGIAEKFLDTSGLKKAPRYEGYGR